MCLPDGAPISKVEATKHYGAEVCMVPGVYDDAYNEALRLRDEKNYTFIHPFDDENVIAGQGTIGLEILNEMPDGDRRRRTAFGRCLRNKESQPQYQGLRRSGRGRSLNG